MAQLIDGELTDRVWDLPARHHEGAGTSFWITEGIRGLLEQDRDETSVEIAHAAFAQKARETGDQPGCVALLRNHPDARGFQRRQEHVRKESNRCASTRRASRPNYGD